MQVLPYPRWKKWGRLPLLGFNRRKPKSERKRK